jgi:hypothetical protein
MQGKLLVAVRKLFEHSPFSPYEAGSKCAFCHHEEKRDKRHELYCPWDKVEKLLRGEPYCTCIESPYYPEDNCPLHPVTRER